MRLSIRAKVIALVVLVVLGAGAVVAFRTVGSSEDQCDKPLSERVGGWTCYTPDPDGEVGVSR
ncbi:hypothetical protein [Actinopolymorpha rutila]|uniref:Uncharacterized protein n=1 Tax=Actinopolymorpha rutila TaxID=446787 RepID=A0A852Z5H3_9ACTN|nr:hypothetical protein [Actinopolymorpha rutila]NYH87623.1 hypothetical protein [Actinopolymorpha rutila]